MTDKYAALDAAILAAIREGRYTFERINGDADVASAAIGIESAQPQIGGTARKPARRFVDQRLQALRKRGLIEHSRAVGWLVK